MSNIIAVNPAVLAAAGLDVRAIAVVLLPDCRWRWAQDPTGLTAELSTKLAQAYSARPPRRSVMSPSLPMPPSPPLEVAPPLSPPEALEVPLRCCYPY